MPAADGGSFRAYLSRPARGSGPGLLLLQEIFGVNETMRAQADQLAEEGYAVVVPDLFWRLEPGVELDYSPEGWQRAFELYGKFDEGKAVEDIAATLEVLRRHPACEGKVGAIGYCLGGKLAFLTGCRTDVDCSVCYYGVGIEKNLDEIGNIKGPMVMHFAELDKFAPPEAVAQDQGNRGAPARYRDPRVPRGRPRLRPGRRRPLRRALGEAGQLPLARIPATGAGTGVGIPRARPVGATSRERVEQGLGFPEVHGVEAFSEPAQHWRQQIVGLVPLAPLGTEPGERSGGAELEPAGVRDARDIDRALEGHPRLLAAVARGAEQQLAP